jgi:hypothetical protein
VLTRGHFGKVRYTWKVWNCGAGEGLRRLDGPIVREMVTETKGEEENSEYNIVKEH